MVNDAELIRVRGVRRKKAWQFGAWAAGSIVAGAAIVFGSTWTENAPRAFLGAIGVQFAIWGAINAVFAVLGLLQSRKADGTPITPAAVEAELRERDKLLGTLNFSHKLNWVWMATGIALFVWAGAAGMRGSGPLTVASLLGHGCGVVLQAAYLMFFDRGFAAQLRGENNLHVAAKA